MGIFDDIVNWASQSQALAMLVFLFIFSLKAFIMNPPLPLLYVAAGIIFPFWMAVLVVYVCLASEMTIGYFNGKLLGEKRVTALLGKKKWAANIINKGRINTLPMVFLMRVVPIPKDPMSMFYGAMGLPFLRFLIVSLLGLTPVMIPFTLAGAAIENPLSAEFIIPFVICLVITVSLLLVYRHKTRADEDSATEQFHN